MNFKDFSVKDKLQILTGKPKTTQVDSVAMDKILALLPDGYVERIPKIVRKHATTKTIERIANEHPDLYAIAKQPGELPADAKSVLRQAVTDIFNQKMQKHNIK